MCEIKSGPAFYKAPGSQVTAMILREPLGLTLPTLAQLVAVCCRTEAKARDFAQRHNVPKSYTKVRLRLPHLQLAPKQSLVLQLAPPV